jgi:hypothetical protein
MKFTIEVEDFYLDEDNDLAPALKQHIISTVVNKISTDLKSKIEDGVQKEVKAQVEQTLYRKITSLTNEVIESDKIKGRYSNDPEITLQEYVKQQFTTTAASKAPVNDKIEQLAKVFGEEMKKRYDMVFAAGIVQKMHENGLLKDDVVSKLLS